MRFSVTPIAFALLVAILSFGSAGASTPSPSPTPSPSSPTPTASPPQTLGAVGVRFVQDGRRVDLRTGSPVPRIVADGADCLLDYLVPAVVGLSSGWVESWPSGHLGSGAPAACTKPPPTTMRFEFSSFPQKVAKEFTWIGGEQIVDLEVPSPRIDVITVRFAKAGRQVVVSDHFVGTSLVASQCLGSYAASTEGSIKEVSISLGSWTGCEPQPNRDVEIGLRTLPDAHTSFFWPHTTFFWPGGDATVFIEVPDGVPTSDLGELVPTATPASLPRTGGHPAETGWRIGFLAAGLATMVVALIAVRFRSVIA